MSTQTILRSNLEFKGFDYWGRAVYLHRQRKVYFCDVGNLGQNRLAELGEVYYKGYDFEGEPDSPVTVTDKEV